MSETKKRFEHYEPNPAQAKRIEELQGAYKFVYMILQALRPDKENTLSLKYLNSAADHLEDSFTKAKMAVLYNDNIKAEEKKDESR